MRPLPTRLRCERRLANQRAPNSANGRLGTVNAAKSVVLLVLDEAVGAVVRLFTIRGISRRRRLGESGRRKALDAKTRKPNRTGPVIPALKSAGEGLGRILTATGGDHEPSLSRLWNQFFVLGSASPSGTVGRHRESGRPGAAGRVPVPAMLRLRPDLPGVLLVLPLLWQASSLRHCPGAEGRRR